jgi:peptidoglycan/LPS O-acetylase OafA/YrhL
MPTEHVVRRLDTAPAPTESTPAQTTEYAASRDRPVASRIVPIDNLKAVLVAWVIAGHAFLGYAVLGGWPYDEVAETTLRREVELVLEIIIGPTALFVIGTFFFLSGLMAPRNISRRGPAAFARQRLVRLGIPWLIFTLLIWPGLMWVVYRSAGYSLSVWQVMRTRQPFLDSGPLWFVQILLYVSLAHALVVGIGQHRIRRRAHAMTLVIAVVAITAASFAIRLSYPARSQQVLDLHVWQWPQCIGLYLLGVVVADRGWAEGVPPRTARRCGIAVLAAVAAGVLVMAILGLSDLKRDGTPFLGGWHWQALSLDLVEAMLVVAGSVWLLAWAQRTLTSRAAGVRRLARSAYAAYLLQVPVLLGLEIAARSLDWPAVAKAILVAVLGVAGAFGIGMFLTPVARAKHESSRWRRKSRRARITAAAPSDAPGSR